MDENMGFSFTGILASYYEQKANFEQAFGSYRICENYLNLS